MGTVGGGIKNRHFAHPQPRQSIGGGQACAACANLGDAGTRNAADLALDHPRKAGPVGIVAMDQPIAKDQRVHRAKRARFFAECVAQGQGGLFVGVGHIAARPANGDKHADNGFKIGIGPFQPIQIDDAVDQRNADFPRLGFMDRR